MNERAIDHIIESWCEAVQHAYKLALESRLAELRGSRTKTLDSRMIHPFSELLGAARMCERLVPTLSYLELDPLMIRRGAEHDAQDEYGKEWARKHGYIE